MIYTRFIGILYIKGKGISEGMAIMIFPKIKTTIFFIGLICGQTYSADFKQIYGRLMNAKKLACEFPLSISAQGWDENHKFRLEKDRISGTTYFQDINIKSRTAKMIGPLGESTVSIHTSLAGLSFFEFPELGNPIYTVVYPVRYDKELKKNELDSPILMATMSRNVLFIPFSRKPIPSQSYGYCKLIE